MSEIKTGLVMEGGAMSGMFTAGVIDVFMENNITFDGAIGVSAGVIFGCNIKSHQIGRVIRYNKKYCRNPRFRSTLSLLFTGSLYNVKFGYETIPNKLDPFDVETYRTNPMKFYMVATDCRKGEPVYKELANGDSEDLKWMRASASMPLVSTVVKIDGEHYLDGALTDSIPLEHFESMGYNRNVVILTRPAGYVKKPESMQGLINFTLRKYPKLVEKMNIRHEMYNRQTSYVFDKAKTGEAIVICPKTELPVSRSDNNPQHLQECYDLGRKAAEEKLDAVKTFLQK